MPLQNTIDAQRLFELIAAQSQKITMIDVRSSGEFEKGSIPYAVNAPILSNEERHKVGWTYKNQGRERALSVGESLVTPDLNRRLDNWQQLIKANLKSQAVVFCWRGGMRSKLVCEWLHEAGDSVLRLKGGYKAFRRQALTVFKNYPKMLVVGGMTGTQKTKLLHALKLQFFDAIVDLEAYANHRGSAFGAHISASPSNQVNFEHKLALALYSCNNFAVIEDESRTIGSVHLPPGLYDHMAQAPAVIVNSSIEQRVQFLFREYIEQPCKTGIAEEQLKIYALKNLKRIQRRLGGDNYHEILKEIEIAFSQPMSLERHSNWIEALLTKYYDRMYTYSLSRKQRPIEFSGSYSECYDWLSQRLNFSLRVSEP